MTETADFQISWHPDGYIEIVLIGVQTRAQLQEMDRQARQLMDEHGAAPILFDGRRGRVGRDAGSLAILMRMRREPRLKKMIVLFTKDSPDPNAARESNVIISILTAVFGKRPVYVSDEAEARELARMEGEG